MNILDHLSDTAKHWLDALSLGALIASLLDWIPGITAILVLLWTAMRIFESWQNIRINHKKLRGD